MIHSHIHSTWKIYGLIYAYTGLGETPLILSYEAFNNLIANEKHRLNLSCDIVNTSFIFLKSI